MTPATPERPLLRIGGMLALFLGLTALGIWWAAPPLSAVRNSMDHFLALPLWMHLLLGLLTISLIGAEALRVIIFGRALGVPIGLRTAIDATIADNFFSWLTPGAALGDPATIYMLGRRGVPWDAAAVIVFGEFATGFAFIMGLSSLFLLLGYGPPIIPWAITSFALAAGSVALILLALLAGAFWPERTLALIDRAERRLTGARPLSRPALRRAIEGAARGSRSAVERLARYRRAGAPGSLAILLSHVLYYGSFVGVLVALAVAFEARAWVEVIPAAVIYQAFVYVAPTPGGSGLGEASAELFFGRWLPGGKAFAVVMLFRLLTFYLHVLIGLVYLPIIGVLGEILRLGRAERAGAD